MLKLHWHAGDVVRKIRIARGLTIENLDELSGVDKGTISKFEKAARDSKGSTLQRICAALEVAPSDVLAAIPVTYPITHVRNPWRLPRSPPVPQPILRLVRSNRETLKPSRAKFAMLSASSTAPLSRLQRKLERLNQLEPLAVGLVEQQVDDFLKDAGRADDEPLHRSTG